MQFTVPVAALYQSEQQTLAATFANVINLSTDYMGKVRPPGNKPALDREYSATMEDLVVGRGYPLETYEVLTEDGYILTLHRIPGARSSSSSSARGSSGPKKPVVFLQHGITLASNCFTLLDHNQSMAFILADAGYDVWLGNNRGNTFSRGHVRYKNNALLASDYWYISMDKLARYDLPAMINFALETSGVKKLALVPHSQGGTLTFMMLSANDAMNDKVSLVVHLAPVAFPHWMRVPVVQPSVAAYTDLLPKVSGLGELTPNYITAPLYASLCAGRTNSPLNLCNTRLIRKFYSPAQLASGVDDNMAIASTWPAGVPCRLLEHWSQLMRQADPRKLSKYDYGSDCRPRGRPFFESCNQKEYNGSSTPPAYDLGNIRTHQAWVTGGLDLVATPEDIAIQLSQVPKRWQVQQLPEAIREYGHMDFVWDRRALHAAAVLKLLQRYGRNTQ